MPIIKFFLVRKLFDTYGILGVLVSIFAIAINYLFLEDVPLIYFLIGLGTFSGLLAFIMQISFILSKFSDVEWQ